MRWYLFNRIQQHSNPPRSLLLCSKTQLVEFLGVYYFYFYYNPRLSRLQRLFQDLTQWILDFCVQKTSRISPLYMEFVGTCIMCIHIRTLLFFPPVSKIDECDVPIYVSSFPRKKIPPSSLSSSPPSLFCILLYLTGHYFCQRNSLALLLLSMPPTFFGYRRDGGRGQGCQPVISRGRLAFIF